MSTTCNVIRNGTSNIAWMWLLQTVNRVSAPVADLSDITRVVVEIDGAEYDSDVLGASVINWTNSEEYPYAGADNAVSADVVQLVLGGQDITPGVYTGCSLTIYSPTYPSGAVWHDDLVFPVLAEGAAMPHGPTWGELLDQARVDLDDKIFDGMDGSDEDLLVMTDDDFYGYAARAQDESCLRAKLIRDDTTPSVCSISVSTGTRRYSVDPRIIDIERVSITTRQGDTLEKKSTAWLDRNVYGWETMTGVPRYWIWDQNRDEIILSPNPSEDATIALSVTRYPIIRPCESWVPEIAPRYRYHLLDWVYHLVYARRDEQVADPKRSAGHAAKFAAIFGDRPDNELLELRRRSDTKKVRARFF